MNNAVLITGGAVRLGGSMSLFLAEQGYDIFLHYNNSLQAAKKLQIQIKKLGVNCELIQADLTKLSERDKLIGKVFKKNKNLNLLINNAATFKKGSLQKTNQKSFHEHFDLNFQAPLFLTRDFSNVVKRGQVINILDTRITKNQSIYFAYTLSKKALAEATLMAASELAPHIRVNGISPGVILPGPGETKVNMKLIKESVPLQRKGSMVEINQALGYLISNKYVTGQFMFVDGGKHL